MLRPTLRIPIGTLLIATIVACAAGDGARERVVVRDSAGVRIVESAGPVWTEGVGWRLSATPVLDIGTVEGDPRYQLFRVWGFTRLDDGRIAVANNGTHELRFYGPDGAFLHAVGAEGEGPGEFRSIQGVWPYRADSLLVWDDRLRRISVFTVEGEFVRSALLQGTLWNPRVIGPFADGSLLLFEAIFEIPDDRPRQQFLHLYRYGPDGARLDSLGRYPHFETTPIQLPGGDRLIAGKVFGPRTVVAATRHRYYVGEAGDYEFAVHAPNGALTDLVRWTGPDRRVGTADVERYRTDALAAADDDNERRRERARLERIAYASEFPAYDFLNADRLGNLWVRAYDRPGDEDRPRWTVFGPDGRMLGDVAMPDDLWVFIDIGDDYVLGVARDEFDVEHVRLYALEK